jgi:hypothetical protein
MRVNVILSTTNHQATKSNQRHGASTIEKNNNHQNQNTIAISSKQLRKRSPAILISTVLVFEMNTFLELP